MPDEESQSEAQAPANPSHVEDITAPIIYADLCFGGGPMNGDNATLSFVTKILDHRTNPPTNATKTVLRLVMPRSAIREMAGFMTKLLDDIAGAQDAPPANAKLN